VNWEQLRTIVWLRWRLSRNQWVRQGGLGAVIALFIGLGAFSLASVSFLLSLLAGALWLGRASSTVIWSIYLGATVLFLFFWAIGLLTELQRSETIDLQRLMHLPVVLGQTFVINYIASHLSLSLVIVVPALLGLALGLAVSRGPAMLLLAPLALGMVGMVTAWTYYLRGWLAALMTNPRRRRAIIMGLTLGIILVAQGPNVYFNVLHKEDRSSQGKNAQTEQTRRERGRERAARQAAEWEKLKSKVLIAQTFIPPLWLPAGAQALAEGHSLPALLGLIGCFVIGGLGLQRAYRATLRFYQGDSGETAAVGAEASRMPIAPGASTKARFLELQLPGVPEHAAAIALATFRSMMRAPEVKLMWASSFLVPIILGVSIFFRAAPNLPSAAKPFVAIGAMAFSIFMLVSFLANQFGFDREGFRALILSPANRAAILLGKNLACLPMAAVPTGLLLTAISFWLRLPPVSAVTAVFQLATMLLLAAMAGNLLSILVPYRVNPGTLKPTKTPGTRIVALVASQLLFPLVLAPAFMPALAGLLWSEAGLVSGELVSLLLSVALAALAAVAYRKALGPLGSLVQRRETKILSAVTSDVE
jgi:hypothetical protein